MKPELLAPAGDWAMLNAAMNSGADAVYFGVQNMNMRHSARNFSIDDLKRIGKLEVKKYLALNTIVFDDEIKEIKNVLQEAYASNIDAVICWDMSVLEMAKELGMTIHLSTQASVSNLKALQFYEKQGVKRFILARELSLDQIKNIKSNSSAEIECFIHGAMCVSVSGRCFMSQFLDNKSANCGRCFQPCRRPYIIKDKESGFELEVGDNYVLSPKDLCTMPFIDRLIASKMDAFKIEGRSKTPEYVDAVVRAYRAAIDAYEKNELTEELKTSLTKDMSRAYNRGFSSGFYLGKPLNEWASSEGNVSEVKKIEVGKVTGYYGKSGVAAIKAECDGFSVGDTLMVIGSTTGIVKQKVESIELDKRQVSTINKGDWVGVKFDKLVRENDRVYKII
ncbi:MAG: peptidase U32 family protein [Candidatus Woesearchaeota archaeon]